MGFWEDLRFAARLLVKDKWVTLVAALALSAVGLYAVTAYSVTQRTQEVGGRMSLGAQSHQVTWLFLRHSFVQLAIELTLGIAGALWRREAVPEHGAPGPDHGRRPADRVLLRWQRREVTRRPTAGVQKRTSRVTLIASVRFNKPGNPVFRVSRPSL